MPNTGRPGRVAHTFYFNTANALLFLLSASKKTLHEGRYNGTRKKWVNWNREYACCPEEFAQPTTEQEICEVVAKAKRLRVVGGGHSFNSSPLSEETLLSLDKYNQILSVDKDRKVVRVQAGIRLRDLGEKLTPLGLGLPCLGSTNAQSIAGLVSTDLHGTGRDHGFLSEQVRSLRIVDASGKAQTFDNDSLVFRAAFGGIGCAGVITEVELQCVEAFHLCKTVKIISRETAENCTDQLIAENDHVSFYYVGSVKADSVRMNCWNRTSEPCSRSATLNKLSTELGDMLYSGYIFGFARSIRMQESAHKLAARLVPIAYKSGGFVTEWHRSFPRKLFFSHDEIEFGVPYENWRACIQEIRELLESQQYLSVVEVRFTPDRSRALLGPGVGRRTCYIELAPTMSLDRDLVFSRAEQIFVKHGGQPHLGKKTYLKEQDLQTIYGERFSQFKKVCKLQDPNGKFLNTFTEQLFGQ